MKQDITDKSSFNVNDSSCRCHDLADGVMTWPILNDRPLQRIDLVTECNSSHIIYVEM